MKRAWAALALAGAGAAFAAAPGPAPNAELGALFEREFRNRIEEHPEIATQLGIPGYDDRWTDLSAAAVARRRAHLGEYGKALERFDAAKLFAVLPRLPYGVRVMEPYEGDNADHYTPGALDGSRAGFFEANVNHLEARPSHEMESVLLHEAVPGHHLQGSRAQELEGLPRLRRVSWFTAYGEGWALYAESLGYEMGFYKDPYSHFGALSAEMLRACRLVIDTGIHALGWSREQSIRYLVDNAGLHPDFAAAEVDRYIVWPGQALGYKIGQLEIRKLRDKATREPGARFDVRRFHNAILDDGPLPLTVLDQRIDAWIAHEKEAAGR
jgi:uncharacterized protein (DUF885 family)